MGLAIKILFEPRAATTTALRGQPKAFGTSVLNLLASSRLAIALMIVLAVAILGTTVDHVLQAEKSTQVDLTGASQAMEALRTAGTYGSWWFILLLSLLTLNLVCSIARRLPNVLRAVRNPDSLLDEPREGTPTFSRRWKTCGTAAQRTEAFRSTLEATFATLKVKEEHGSVQLCAERGLLSRFGPDMAHVGILLVLFGAAAGSIFGFKSQMAIPDGQEASRIPFRGEQRSIALPFSVRNNGVRLETYPNGRLKGYSTDLGIVENGRDVLRKTIRVNEPLFYKGVGFYWSGYGQAGPPQAQIVVKKKMGRIVDLLTLAPGDWQEVPEYGTVKVVDYRPDLNGSGPALEVVLEKPGKPAERFWLLQRSPNSDWQRQDDHYLVYTVSKENLYVALRVVRDPGVYAVWAGYLLLMAGILIVFFTSHRRIRVRISPLPVGRVEVHATGVATRNAAAFERKFDSVLSGSQEWNSGAGR
jgi:cytochrome c biogenesis protein